MIKRNWLIFILTVLAAAAGYFYFQPSAVSASVELTAEVQQGKFEIFVTSTGELKAKNQTEIMAPGAQLREAGIYSELKIEDLIQEGTVVKAGDYVASIEKNPIMKALTKLFLLFLLLYFSLNILT